ncbi:MAG: branched-chain alpha-ketoacid dehydrogenase [Piptocephalis tieghemiana]|nr:MAG: branched-chain alpha-ketoacid dehydrogenase [Piptocephalis tieghemiana]
MLRHTLPQCRSQPSQRALLDVTTSPGSSSSMPSSTPSSSSPSPPSSSSDRIPTIAATQKHRSPTSPQHFYHNRIISQYAARSPIRLTLRQLMVFGRSLTEDRLLKSANYVREELPVRLAHRIQDFQRLPFIVVTNPHIAAVYSQYWGAFDELRRVPEIRTLEENHLYCQRLTKLLDDHRVVIPQLALGIREASCHFDPDAFVSTCLRGRISRRVLAEQHIALTHQFAQAKAKHLSHPASDPRPQYIGLLDTRCDVHALLHQCIASATEMTEREMGALTRLSPSSSSSPSSPGPSPKVIIEGVSPLTIPCHPEHLKYVLHEILRNAMRYTRIAHPASDPGPVPPITVTLCANAGDVVIRISDRGGGIHGDPSRCFALGSNQVEKAWKLPQFEAKVDEAIPEDVHLGIGLPMSRVYMEYWGGHLEVRTLVGWGTDVYIKMGRLGNIEEHLAFSS